MQWLRTLCYFLRQIVKLTSHIAFFFLNNVLHCTFPRFLYPRFLPGGEPLFYRATISRSMTNQCESAPLCPLRKDNHRRFPNIFVCRMSTLGMVFRNDPTVRRKCLLVKILSKSPPRQLLTKVRFEPKSHCRHSNHTCSCLLETTILELMTIYLLG